MAELSISPRRSVKESQGQEQLAEGVESKSYGAAAVKGASTPRYGSAFAGGVNARRGAA